MNKINRVTTKPREEQDVCIHFWIVGHPKNGVSKAICKYCGARKEFSSMFMDTRWTGEMPIDFPDSFNPDNYSIYED